MEILYKNKFLVSISVGLLVSIVFYNYNMINNEPIKYMNENDDVNEIYNPDENKNKDNSLYLFLAVSLVIFMALYFTEDNVDDVFQEIDTGEVPF